MSSLTPTTASASVTQIWTESFKRTWKDWRFLVSFGLVYLAASLLLFALFVVLLGILGAPVAIVGWMTESEGLTFVVAIPLILLFLAALAVVGWAFQAFLSSAVVGSIRARQLGERMTFSAVWSHGKQNWRLFCAATRLRIWCSAAFVALFVVLTFVGIAVVLWIEGNVVDPAVFEGTLLLLLLAFVVVFPALILLVYIFEIGITYASFAALSQPAVLVPKHSTRIGFGFFKRQWKATLGAFGLMLVGGFVVQLVLGLIQLPVQLISVVPVIGWIISLVMTVPLMALSYLATSFLMIWGCDVFMHVYQDRQPGATLLVKDVVPASR